MLIDRLSDGILYYHSASVVDFIRLQSAVAETLGLYGPLLGENNTNECSRETHPARLRLKELQDTQLGHGTYLGRPLRLAPLWKVKKVNPNMNVKIFFFKLW